VKFSNHNRSVKFICISQELFQHSLKIATDEPVDFSTAAGTKPIIVKSLPNAAKVKTHGKIWKLRTKKNCSLL
jgi:hypothetical protein